MPATIANRSEQRDQDQSGREEAGIGVQFLVCLTAVPGFAKPAGAQPGFEFLQIRQIGERRGDFGLLEPVSLVVISEKDLTYRARQLVKLGDRLRSEPLRHLLFLLHLGRIRDRGTD
jgi:hypothetical protein